MGFAHGGGDASPYNKPKVKYGMPSKKDKKEFQWESGSRLDSDDYAPLGSVREVGFSKLADGIAADPVQRKEARKKKLLKTLHPQKEGEIFKEESQSGLNEEVSVSEASKLLHKDSSKFKGINRFQGPGDKKSFPKSPGKKS